jgi:Fibronectin type III domain
MSTSAKFRQKSGEAEVVSWSKDSIFIRWHFDEDIEHGFHGYMVRYQAIGSSVVQHTRLLDPTTSVFDITQLHENTNYDICVVRLRLSSISLNSGGILLPAVSAQLPPTGSPLDAVATACVKGATSTDSLSVALGSTFGAFLTLALIVALVFVAKWQHVRRAKKRLEALEGSLACSAKLDDIEGVFRGEEQLTVVESGNEVLNILIFY